MSNPNKIKGDRFELAVQHHMQRKGFPWCEKTRAGYARDHGDLHLEPVTRAVIAQCKNHNRLALPEWLDQLARQVDDAGARHGMLVVKRRGVTDPGRSLVVMDLDAALRLVRAAGYGTPLDDEDDTADTAAA